MKILFDYDPFYDPLYKEVKKTCLIEGHKLGYQEGLKKGYARAKEDFVLNLLTTGEISTSKIAKLANVSVSSVYRRKVKFENTKDQFIVMSLDFDSASVEEIAQIFKVSVEYVLAIKANLDEQQTLV